MIICNRKHFPRNPDSQIFCLYSLKWTMCVSFSALEGDWLVYYFGHQRFLISNTSVLTRYMSAGLSFRTKRKLLSSLRYPFPWKALQIRISLKFCDCGSLCNNAVLHLFFLIGNTKRKKHGETRAARTYVAQLDGYGVFPPFFVFFFGPLHPLSKHRTPTWWLIFFFNSVYLFSAYSNLSRLRAILRDSLYVFLIARNKNFDKKILSNNFSKWLSKRSHPPFCISH